MKRWISPPIQWLLWLGGLACLGAAAWHIWELRQLEAGQVRAGSVQVSLPDAGMLTPPPLASYRQQVEAPLFWEARSVPKPAPVAPPPVAAPPVKPEEPEIERVPPTGRLVGIVDLGNRFYALVRNETDSQSLHPGDQWESWTVASIDADKVVLTGGKQRLEIPLIGDFSAPKANKEMLAQQQREEQRRRHQQQRQQLEQRAEAADQDGLHKLAEQLTNAGAAAGDNAEQPAPVMSIKEALEARQRLMASRWGNNQDDKKDGN
ncbi:MAG: hypothetical protein R3E89_01205 [Thiolinea sp.]